MLSNTVDLKKLRAFHLVAKHGDLGSAATRLLLSTSAISIQITQLEKELGVKLFRRAGRKLVLEPAGKVFLDHVTGILKAVDDAIASVSTSKMPKRHISIAIGPDLTRIFSGAIGKFIKLYPDVEISLQLKTSRESLVRILDGEIDMVVGYFGSLPKNLVKKTLMKSGFSMSFAPSHPLAKIKSPSLAEIAQYPLIALRQQTSMGQRIMNAFSEAGVAPVNYLEVGNCQSSQDLAAQGIGVAIAHTTCLHGYKTSEMRSIDISHYLGKVDVAVVYRKSQELSPLHQELADEMARLANLALAHRHAAR
ncbi:MAG TPA: LysR family transcriptional regulator [Alphaproteobacteria bacterium]|jgi:DNA-binding transcriptional LysR family regulator